MKLPPASVLLTYGAVYGALIGAYLLLVLWPYEAAHG